MVLDMIVPIKDIANAIKHAIPIPNLSLDIQIASGSGRYAVLKTRRFSRISVDMPAAM